MTDNDISPPVRITRSDEARRAPLAAPDFVALAEKGGGADRLERAKD